MLLELFRWLGEDIRAFQVFNYLSLRAVLAALTALAIGFMAGPATIRYLRAMKMGQAVRTNGPKTHIVKDGTPTMGGVLILIAIGLSTLLWMDLSNRFVWVVLFVTLGFGWIGWVDDYRKVVHHDPKGMSAKEKFGWQSLIGIIASVYLAFAISAPNDIHVVHMLIGWVESASADSLKFARKYLGVKKKSDIPMAIVRSAWGSVAMTAVAQMQDFLESGKDGRMNTPSTLGNNWQFRAFKSDFTPKLAKKIRKLNKMYNR